MASKKDNKRLTAKTLIDKGKKQGSLTLSEIMEAFSETELQPLCYACSHRSGDR